jgi:hypothetical protein
MGETDKSKRQAILHELFDGYAATSDFPGMFFVDDLVEMYPGVKIVLNKRSSAEAWHKSIKDTLAFFSSRTYFYLTYLVPTDYWHARIHNAAKALAERRYVFFAIRHLGI